jgi:hypothetical protein
MSKILGWIELNKRSFGSAFFIGSKWWFFGLTGETVFVLECDLDRSIPPVGAPVSIGLHNDRWKQTF